MADDYSFRLRVQGSDVVDQLPAVRVSGEAVHDLHVHLEVHGDLLSLVRQGELLHPSLDLAADRSVRLISDEHQGGGGIAGPGLHVFHDRSAVHHAARRQHDAGLHVMQDVLAHLLGIDPLEHVAQEGVLPHLEDLGAQLAVEVFRIGGMDGGSFPDAPVQVDRDLVHLTGAGKLLDHQHDLLGTPDGEHRHDDLSLAFHDRPFDDAAQLRGRIDPAGLYVVRTAIGGLDDQRLQPGELVRRGVEKPAPLVLHVAGERHIVSAVADVEVADGRTQDMTGVLHRQTNIAGDVRGLSVLQGDAVLDHLAHMLRLVLVPLGLAIGHLDGVYQAHGHEVPGRWGAVHRPVVAVLEQGG